MVHIGVITFFVPFFPLRLSQAKVAPSLNAINRFIALAITYLGDYSQSRWPGIGFPTQTLNGS
jgi:hypothetical protein